MRSPNVSLSAAFGKWHMGWNREAWGDQKHGPLGQGFDYFFGLPFTLVHGFETGAKESFFSISRFTKGNFLTHSFFWCEIEGIIFLLIHTSRKHIEFIHTINLQPALELLSMIDIMF